MRVVEIALFTEDPDRLIAFYEDVLEAAPESRWSGGAIFAVGDVKLLIHIAGPTRAEGPPNRDHFAFSVGDVDEAAARLGVEARDYDWGRSAYLRDPDGRVVELT
ncbi:MAG: VOC family protein [Actinobacteria bacterium]|nr:VOC family protein [Actinomycetota bacterium]